MVYFVTRHQGAKAWAYQQGLAVDQFVEQFDAGMVRAGDVVIGTLPVHLAAAVGERGGRYLHLTMDLSRAKRGVEMDAAAMAACGARVEEYAVTRRSA